VSTVQNCLYVAKVSVLTGQYITMFRLKGRPSRWPCRCLPHVCRCDPEAAHSKAAVLRWCPRFNIGKMFWPHYEESIRRKLEVGCQGAAYQQGNCDGLSLKAAATLTSSVVVTYAPRFVWVLKFVPLLYTRKGMTSPWAQSCNCNRTINHTIVEYM
jgi:hypothetical protein